MDTERELHQWNLFKAYGEFNLLFESVIAEFKVLQIELIRRYYGFDVDWEDDETEEELNDNYQDRLLKIILDNAGANAIIESCRACFIDSFKEEVQSVLRMNDITPIKISNSDYEFSISLFKKGVELVKLRNIIIHSHYDGVVLNIFPNSQLKGRKEVKTGKGYELREYEYTINYFEKVNVEIENLALLVRGLFLNLSIHEQNRFKHEDLKSINEMNFSPPLIKR